MKVNVSARDRLPAGAKIKPTERRYEKLWDTRIERLVELLRHPGNQPDHTK